MCPYTIFQQSASDNNIFLDQISTKYIFSNRCDVFGRVNYVDLIKDMVIKMNTDFAGSVKCAWHIR